MPVVSREISAPDTEHDFLHRHGLGPPEGFVTRQGEHVSAEQNVRATFNVWTSHKEPKDMLCALFVDLHCSVRNLKEHVRMKKGIACENQKLLLASAAASGSELFDLTPLDKIAVAGDTVDLVLVNRNTEVAAWLAKISRDPSTISAAPMKLVEDLEFLLPAIQIQGRCLEFVPSEVFENRDILMQVLSCSGQALMYAPEQIRADREAVLAAVRQDGWALEYACEELQADREVVMAAVQQDGWALQFASEHFHSDQEIVLMAAKKDAWIINMENAPKITHEMAFAAIGQDWRVFEALSADLRADKALCLAACRQAGWALQWAGPELKNDREVVLAAVAQTGESLRFGSQDFCSDYEVIATAVRTCGLMLSAAAPGLQDLAMAATAVRQNPHAIQCVEPRLLEALKKEVRWTQSWSFDNTRNFPSRLLNNKMKEHFSTLGLSQTATFDEVKRAFRALALKHHPDKQGDDEDIEQASQEFQQAHLAYNAIKDALRL